MYYLIDNDPDQRYSDNQIEELLTVCIPDDKYEDDRDSFDNYLDEEYGSISINGINYYASRILYEMDYNDYTDAFEDRCRITVESDRDDADYTIRHLNAGNSAYIGDYIVYAYDDEEEVDIDTDDLQDTCSMIEQRLEAESILLSADAEENERRQTSFDELFQMISK